MTVNKKKIMCKVPCSGVIIVFSYISGLSSCEKLYFIDEISTAVFGGCFYLIGLFNDRALYQNSLGTLYLYYLIEPHCAMWTVGENVGDSNAVAFTYDCPFDPVDIAGPWYTLYITNQGEWVSRNLRVVCLD